MKRIMLPAAIALTSYMYCNAVATDSVQVYLYTDSITAGHDGLHWAWQDDAGTWHNDVAWQKLVSSDYGAWGSQKRMIKPYVERNGDIIIKLVNILPASVHISGLPHGVVRFSCLEPTLGIDEQQFSIGAGGETMLPPRSLTILRYLK